MKNKIQKIVAVLLSVAFLFSGAIATNAAQNFTPVQTPQVSSLTTYISQTATSIIVNNFSVNGVLLTMANFGVKGFATIEPNNSTNQEQIDFTGVTRNSNGTATLTGVGRGISFVYPYVSVIANMKSHATGAILTISNTAEFYSNFLSNINTATITQPFIFGSTTPPTYDFIPSNFAALASTTLAPKGYVDSAVIGGGVPANPTTAGISKISTGAQAAAGTAGDGIYYYALTSSIATSTCQSAANSVLIASSTTGKLPPTCLDTTAPYTFTATTTTATTSIASLTVNGSTIYPYFGGTGADGALNIASGTTTINLNGQAVFEKDYTSITIGGTTGSLAFSNPNANGTTVILRSQGACIATSTGVAIDLSAMGGSAGVGFAAINTTGGGKGGDGGGISGGKGSYISEVSGGSGSASAGSGGGGGGSALFGTAGTFSSPAIGTGNMAFSFGGSGGVNSTISSSTLFVNPGGGGGGGTGAANYTSSNGSGGNGGVGGGSLVLACNGALNFTGNIKSVGANGSAGQNVSGSTSGGGGGGGGGAGGNILILYNSLTANSGTFTLTAGSGGAGGTATTQAGATGGAGSAGASLIAKNSYFN